MIIRRKPPRELKLNEPIRHESAHKRPVTRRDFIAQGFIGGSATIIAPPMLAAVLTAPRANAQTAGPLAADIQALVNTCGITNGAGKIPFICFDLSGGGNLVGSEALGGGPGGQTDFLSAAGYGLQGLPPTMLPSMAGGTFVDSSLGLKWHSDGAILRAIKTRASVASMAGTNGAIIAASSQNDTNTNPHNPMYGIAMAGANGQLLRLIGTDATMSGGNSMSPADEMVPAWTPSVIQQGSDSAGLVNTGLLTQLLAPADAVSVLESMERISAFKLANVNTQLTNDAAVKQAAQCNYVKAAYLADQFPNSSVLDPDLDPVVVDQSATRSSGIFGQAEYQQNNNFQATAAVMKLVVNGYAGAGTIQMGGFDYHGQGRNTGETRNFEAGVCIGAVLEYAHRVKKPVMIYVFTDGGINANSTIDTTVAGRDKFMWQGDNSTVTSTFFLLYNPAGRTPALALPTGMNQIGYWNPDGNININSSPAGNAVNLLVQTVLLNYFALHGQQGNFATVLGSYGVTVGLAPSLFSSLIAFPAICNGTIAGGTFT
jgi:hypothetical protein